MEVTGEKGKQIQILCDPCLSDGCNHAAKGYCEDCQEYLCSDCYDAHTKPTPMRKHKLLDVRAIPKSKKETGARRMQLSTWPCPNHQHKMVEIYCCRHKVAVCGVCAHKRHGICDTEDIGEVSQDYIKSREYSGLKDTSDQLQNTVDKLQRDVGELIKDAETSMDRVVEDVKAFKLEMIAKFEKMEQDLLKEAQKMKEKDKEIMETAEVESQSMKEELARQKSELQMNKNNNCDLYLASQRALEQVQTIEKSVERTKGASKAITYSFKANKTLRSMMNEESNLGTISRDETKIPTVKRKPNTRSHPQTTPHGVKSSASNKSFPRLENARLALEKNISVNTTEDKCTCYINGAAVLSSGRLLLADRGNCSVKLVDTSTNTVTSSLKVAYSPWDVTVLTQDQAAVTITFAEQIQVISTSGALSPVRAINVKGKCRGICSTQDKMVVCYGDPVKVEIMDHHRGVLQTINNDTLGQPLFKYPNYVAITSEEDREVIYVSDMAPTASRSSP